MRIIGKGVGTRLLFEKKNKRTKATGRKQLKEIFNDLNYVERKKESMIRRSIILLEYYLCL